MKFISASNSLGYLVQGCSNVYCVLCFTLCDCNTIETNNNVLNIKYIIAHVLRLGLLL